MDLDILNLYSLWTPLELLYIVWDSLIALIEIISL